MLLFVQVMVDIAHSNVDRLFTYALPDALPVAVGQRVLVPFGAGNKKIEGFVLGLSERFEGGANIAVKPVLRVMEPYPALSEEQIALAKWIAASYDCLLVEALRLMIPVQLRGGKIKEKIERTVYFPAEENIEAALASLCKKDGAPRAPLQYEALQLVANCKADMRISDITAFIPGSGPAVRALINRGLLKERGHEVYRSPLRDMAITRDAPKELNAQQRLAADAVGAALDAHAGAFLLHGVTGSGKTEVYMHAIAKAVQEGGTAIVLVPEIALTPQAVERFRARFGERIAVLHSRLSAGERYDEWRRIRLNKVDVVIGARSAVFAPLSNIRLIVVDEEHEPSYRSEITPRYSAVEVAQRRCRLNGAVLLLGSATPGVSTYLKAQRGKLTLLRLTERVQNLPMPKVLVADMRAEFAAGNTSVFSAPLYDRLSACFAAGEQAILFLNRRGYSTFVSCRGCGYVFTCDACDISMTYHKQEDALKCHYCGSVKHLPKVCPECGKPYIKYFGIGTQQVEEQLHEHFPSVRALRMDMDTTHGKNAHYEILSAFERGEAQALIGTQMVAKGLDMPNVTVVGVIAADATLHIPDYRSGERTFQLLTQVAGRAGRAQKSGQVVIQTYTPEHPAIQLAARHDYIGFYTGEIERRRSALFPPYSLFVRALFAHTDEALLCEAASRFAEGVEKAVQGALSKAGADVRELIFCACARAPIKRKQGQYRYQVLLKLARTAHASAAMQAIYAYTNAHRSEYFAALEVNPQDMF
ncbi:MAG: primosomal protein N' [Christensenellaceae bacterium]|jgi:primosomal protein N' (replication factor Y)|nr:primosomal protein N' [Christensenellaceae bacterium]